MSIDVHSILGMSAQPRGPVAARPTTEKAAGQKPAPQQPVSPRRETDIGAIVEEMQLMSALNRRLKFTVNPDLNQVIVKVIDRKTDKVIKELPPEGIQRLYARIQEAIGLLIDEEI